MNSNRMNISVIICTYNGAKFINEQIDSILNQSYPAKELIHTGDCSTDNTLEYSANMRPVSHNHRGGKQMPGGNQQELLFRHLRLAETT